MHQHRLVEKAILDQHVGENVRPVRIAKANDLGRLVFVGKRLYEIDHLFRRSGQVRHVVDAFAGPLEEARRAMFRHVAAR
ncbi:hypothetical protein D9M72_555720 [compost metagenome]